MEGNPEMLDAMFSQMYNQKIGRGFRARRPLDSFEIHSNLTKEIEYLKRVYMDQPNKMKSYITAMRAESALTQSYVFDAVDGALEAVNLDHNNLDAWRLFVKTLNSICDGDTNLISIRSVMSYFQPRIIPYLEEWAGRFFEKFELRPYLRLLMTAGSVSNQSEQIHLAIRCFEEMIRLDNDDHYHVAYPLCLFYMKVHATKRRKMPTLIDRDVSHAKALFYSKLPHQTKPLISPEYQKDLYLWIKVLIDFALNQLDDSDIQELKKLPSFSLLLRLLVSEDFAFPNDYSWDMMTKGSRSVFSFQKTIQDVVQNWPELIIRLSSLSEKERLPVYTKLLSKATETSPDWTRERMIQNDSMGQHLLNSGRDCVRTGSFESAVCQFSTSRRAFFDSMLPGHRSYMNTPFAVFSNRFTVSIPLKLFNLALVDARLTLTVKPDHARTYLKIKMIGEAFQCKSLTDRLLEIEEKSKETTDLNDWMSLAKQAVALLSVRSIMMHKEGTIDQETLDFLIKVGIEDLYYSIKITDDWLAPLPWVSEGDVDEH